MNSNMHCFIILIVTFGSCFGQSDNVKVTTTQYRVPILAKKENNPVLRMEVALNPSKSIEVRQVKIALKSTADLKDIRSVRLFYTGNEEQFNTNAQFGTDQPPSSVITFKDRITATDTSYLWVSIELQDEVDLLQKITVWGTSINTKRGIVLVEPVESKALRVGIALRQHKDDGVHTYRIPGLTTTNNGTLLAVYDTRRDSPRDVQGNVDVGLSRSVDGGNTWEPMRIPLDMGEWGGLPEKFNGVGDVNILVDRTNNNVFVAGLWMHGVLDKNGNWIEGLTEQSDVWEHQWKNKGSQPGFGVRETSQFVITKSTDDGKTWSEPVNLTTMLKKKKWWLFAPAPGHGITLNDGTLVMPTQGRDETGEPFSNITWSKDGGQTWQASEPAYHNTTECMAVQLSDGAVMLNMRYNANKNNTTDSNGRVVSITDDLGATWTEHPSSRSALIEPVCMASLHRHEYTQGGQKKSVLLFSNPDSKTSRHRMTIKVSFDDGKTWPKENWILLDEKKSRGYSCITSIDDNTIGILYEGSQAHMTFQKIKLSDLLNPDK